MSEHEAVARCFLALCNADVPTTDAQRIAALGVLYRAGFSEGVVRGHQHSNHVTDLIFGSLTKATKAAREVL
jgi:hypothetical protein